MTNPWHTPDESIPELESTRDFMPPRDGADRSTILREYRLVMYRYSFVGIEFGCAVLFGVFVGGWLDKKWGIAPWMTSVDCLKWSTMSAGSLTIVAVNVLLGAAASVFDDDNVSGRVGLVRSSGMWSLASWCPAGHPVPGDI